MMSKPHNLVIDSFSAKPSFQEEDASLPVLMFMCQNNYDFLPLMKGTEFQGIISRQQLSMTLLDKQHEDQSQLNENEQVVELKKELSLKNKFLSIIGHDIKNMFNQVLGSMELLDHKLESLDANKIHTILRLARRSAEQVNSAFDGMLLWARLGTGQLPFQPQELLLNEQFDRLVNQFQLAGNVKNITIKNCLTTESTIFADANMLGSILLNLIYNAIKFTSPGGEVWLDATQTESQTKVVVVDSGLGMSLQQQQQLFKHGHSTAGTSNEMGAGIGLVICKEFTERHGGIIEVESEQGKGTRVIVTLPNQPVLASNAGDALAAASLG
jgi:signal transduction histidine kinase